MRKYIIIAVIAVAGFLGIAASTASTDYFEITKNLEIFATLYKEVNTHYVDDIDPNDLMQEGIDAMLKSLDPYTSFYSEAEIEDYRFQTTGKYGGIGSLIQRRDDYVIISEPYQGFAADKAGLLAGDKIAEVDGQSVKGKNSADISALLKGEPGTTIHVKLLRPQADGTDKEIELDITREEVKVKNVPYYGMIEDGIGYIKLSNFTQKAGEEVADAYKALKEEDENLKGVILDVRGNPGGLLHEAVNITNVFIDKGELVVFTKGKYENTYKEFKTLNEPLDTEIPLVVLTSRSSASASEIVSGAIQDLDRGVVIGQKTFGKGLVQTTKPLTYNTQLKVTTAKYYIPSGRCIQAIDYADRDENGAVSKMADSLKVAFETKNGRTVYDGGGIDPDIIVELDDLSNISISLYTKNLVFDYATHYRANHETLRNGAYFRLAEDEYDDFVAWLQDKDYDYTTQSEELLEELKETAIEEDYFEAIENSYKELNANIGHDKKNDLEKQKEEIKMLLENEIVLRYEYRSGAIANNFAYDKEIKEALLIFNNSEEYNQLLQAQK